MRVSRISSAPRGSSSRPRRRITVKFMMSAGEYLHERYHGRLYAKAQNLRAGLRAKYDAVLAKFDALVMPSTPMKAHRRDERCALRDADQHRSLSISPDIPG